MFKPFPSAYRTVCVCAAALMLTTPASADPVTRSTLGWAVNGIVSEVARAGDVAFVGGSFGTVAPSSNQVFGFGSFAIDSAFPVLPALQANGRVRAVVALPAGGWLVGGEFSSVGGEAHQRLVRLLPNGEVDPMFTGSASGTVWTMTVAGGKVYLGGSFTQVNGANRRGLAALDAATLALDATFLPAVEGGSASVRALLVDNTTVYVGGSFAQLNGSAQANLGAVNASTGATVVAFTGTADGRVGALALSGTALIAAGDFQSIGGLMRRGVARLAAATGVADAAFNANSNGSVNAVAVAPAGVFVAGSFGQIGGQDREHLALLNTTTGAAASWNPGADGDVSDVALVGSALLVAGHFTEVGGEERLYAAALDTTLPAGPALPWNPSLNSSADSLDVDPSGFVFIGGGFNYFGAVRRQNLAAINLLTGELLPWNPGANGWVRALDIAGNTVYIGGDFTTIGGVSRSRIAGLDGVTGVVTAWTANPNGPVKGLMVAGNAVYFVGSFTQIKNSTSRGRGAAVDFDGTVLPWNPSANGIIESLFVTDTRAYLGGQFTTLGGVTHTRLGAVDATTGAQSPAFVPSVDGTIYRVDLLGDLLFFGGDFDLVSGSTRSNAAAVKVNAGMSDDGALQGWNPNVGGPVYDIDAFGSNVFLAGGFGSVGGESRPGIAMVDALPAGGSLRTWEPEDVSGGSISVIDTSETAVLFGGLLYDENHIEIGAVLYPETLAPGTPRPPTTPDVLVRGNRLTLNWTAPPLGARPTTYVIEGGSGPGLRDLANFGTGSTGTSFTTAGLGPGTYYVRMRSGNSSGTGAASLEQAFTVGGAGCSGPPTPPLDLRATVTGTSVRLDWRAAVQSIASTYRVLAGTASGVTDIGAFDVGNVTTFTTTAPQGAYFVRVQGVNACGHGAASEEAVAVVGAAVVPPGAPFGLDGAASGSTVNLTWGAPSAGTGPFAYRVEAGSAAGLANLATIVVATPSFSTTGVPPGVYYVRVRAIGAGGTGPVSNEIVIVVQ